MTSRAEACPLQWPAGRPRSEENVASRFSTGFGSALKLLLAELRRLGARDSVISTNLPLTRDGMPRANMTPGDPGVACYFTLNGKPTCFACDRWKTVAENLYAIAKTIEALRGIQRWGSKDAVGAAFIGFAALPAPSWRHTLGVINGEGLADVEARYRGLARDAHPDRGGSHDRMAALTEAIGAARKELGR